MIQVFRIMNGYCSVSPDYFFCVHMYPNTRGHPYKIIMRRSNLGVHWRLLSQKVVPVWNSLNAETITKSSLSSSKELLDF